MNSETLLVEFLKSGRLGNLRLGMSLDETIAYLGVPDGFERINFSFDSLHQTEHANEKTPVSTILYGLVELTYDRLFNKLIYIKLRFYDFSSEPIIKFREPLLVDWFLLASEIIFDDFVKLLNDNKIEWTIIYEGDDNSLYMKITKISTGIVFNIGKIESITIKKR